MPRAHALRCAVLTLLVAACAPKVRLDDPPFEQDDPRASTIAPAQPKLWKDLPEAPPGPGVRGATIQRTQLQATLDAGPGAFLRGFEVAAELDDGQRFHGWRLVQVLPGEHRFAGLDLVPGDVLVAVNGRSISRPDQLEALWTSLRTTDEIVLDLERSGSRFALRFTIEPAVQVAPPLAPIDGDAGAPVPPR